MALYMYQAAYTAESVAAQIKEPQDRIEAVRPALEALGGKILVGGYPFGDYDVLAVYEAPDDTAAAAFAVAIAAGGAVRSAKTTRLLTGQEWIESLRKAQGSNTGRRDNSATHLGQVPGAAMAAIRACLGPGAIHRVRRRRPSRPSDAGSPRCSSMRRGSPGKASPPGGAQADHDLMRFRRSVSRCSPAGGSGFIERYWASRGR